jgi:cysteine synthase
MKTRFSTLLRIDSTKESESTATLSQRLFTALPETKVPLPCCACKRPSARKSSIAWRIVTRATLNSSAITADMTFACATDGNHGRSVAQGAKLVGARAVVFVHSGVSQERVAAIASFGAGMVRVAGSYDDSVEEAARVADKNGWTIVSDTSWPGYERIPGLGDAGLYCNGA